MAAKTDLLAPRGYCLRHWRKYENIFTMWFVSIGMRVWGVII